MRELLDELSGGDYAPVLRLSLNVVCTANYVYMRSRSLEHSRFVDIELRAHYWTAGMVGSVFDALPTRGILTLHLVGGSRLEAPLAGDH